MIAAKMRVRYPLTCGLSQSYMWCCESVNCQIQSINVDVVGWLTRRPKQRQMASSSTRRWTNLRRVPDAGAA